MTPGPIERSWRSRLRYKLFGYWPAAVVEERLAAADAWHAPDHLKTLIREVYERDGAPVPPEFR